MHSVRSLLSDVPNDIAGSVEVKSEPKCIPANGAMLVVAPDVDSAEDRKDDARESRALLD